MLGDRSDVVGFFPSFFTSLMGSAPTSRHPIMPGNAAPTENANGLIRQYLPKRLSMKHLTQHDCNRVAAQLNRRPRKRLGYRTPEECYVP